MFWPSPPADSYLPAQEHIQLLSWESPPRLSTELCWLHGRVYLLTGAQQNMLLRTERLPSALLGLSWAHSLCWFRLCLSPSLERAWQTEPWAWPGLASDTGRTQPLFCCHCVHRPPHHSPGKIWSETWAGSAKCFPTHSIIHLFHGIFLSASCRSDTADEMLWSLGTWVPGSAPELVPASQEVGRGVGRAWSTESAGASMGAPEAGEG